MIALLALFGCSEPNPMDHSDFIAASESPAATAGIPPVRVGQAVVVEWTFRSKEKGHWNGSIGSAVGRPTQDVFMVRPLDGVLDPDPYWEDLGGRVRSKTVKLQPEPTVVTMPVDEVRFTKPGRYALQLLSSRTKAGFVSPVVEVVVTERDAALDKTVREAALKVVNTSKDPDTIGSAFRDLIALDDSDTLDLALSQWTSGESPSPWWGSVVGGYSNREEALARIDRTLMDPAVPVDRALVEVRARVVYNQSFPTPRVREVPPTPAQVQEVRLRRERLQAAREEGVRLVAEALPKKTPEATVPTLVALAREPIAETADWAAAFRTQLVAQLPALPDADAAYVLRKYRSSFMQRTAVPGLMALAERVGPAGDEALQILIRSDPDTALQVVDRRIELERMAMSAQTAQGLRTLPLSPERASAVARLLQSHPSALPWAEWMAVSGPYREQGMAAARAATSKDASASAELHAAYFVWQSRLNGASMGDLGVERHPGVLQAVLDLHPDPESLYPELLKEWQRCGSDRACVEFAKGVATTAPRSARPAFVRDFKNADSPLDEYTAAIIMVKARNWIVTAVDGESIKTRAKFKVTKELLKTAVFAPKGWLGMSAGMEWGEPVLEFDGRRYQGQEQIVAKLRQVPPETRVGFTFRDGSGAKEAFEAMALEAKVVVAQDRAE